MLARARELTTKVLRWYEEFEFHRIYHAVNEFAIVDLSALYVDVLKDRLYTFAPNSAARRAAQTVFGRSPKRWRGWSRRFSASSPMRSGSICPRMRSATRASTRRSSLLLMSLRQRARRRCWRTGQQLLAIREEALRSLEEARQEKRIGKALEAKLTLELPAEPLADRATLRVQPEGALQRLPGRACRPRQVTEARATTTEANGASASAAGTTALTSASIRAGQRCAAAVPARSTKSAFLLSLKR